MTFEDFLAGLSDEQLIKVSKEIYADNAAPFVAYLRPVRTDDLRNQLFIEIDQLPAILIRKLLKYKNELLSDALTHSSEKTDTVIRTAIRFSVDYNSPIFAATLKQAIYTETVSKRSRFGLALYLSKRKDIDKDLLEKATASFSYLFPALLNRLKLDEPINTLLKLDFHAEEINNENKIMVQTIIVDLLTNYLSLEGFNPNNYNLYIRCYHQLEISTQKLIMEVFEQEPKLQAIWNRLHGFENELVPAKPELIFTPQEVTAARKLLMQANVENVWTEDDFLSYNLKAITYSLVEMVQSQEDRSEITRKMFAIFNKMYQRHFRDWLIQFKTTYDPMNEQVYIGDQEYPFAVKLESFTEAVRDFRQTYKGNRRAVAQKLMEDQIEI